MGEVRDRVSKGRVKMGGVRVVVGHLVRGKIRIGECVQKVWEVLVYVNLFFEFLNFWVFEVLHS